MKKLTKPWHALLPGGLSPAAFSLDELRAAKSAHGFLTENIPGPEDVAEAIRAFRIAGCRAKARSRETPSTPCRRTIPRSSASRRPATT